MSIISTVQVGDITVSVENTPRKVINSYTIRSFGSGTLGVNGYPVYEYDDGSYQCACQDFTYRSEGRPGYICKHIEEVWPSWIGKPASW